MSDTPKPDTTLSDEDAAKVEVFANPYARGFARGLVWNRAEIVRIIRDLDARLALALSLANERGAEYEIREVRAENAALTERLRIAEEKISTIADARRDETFKCACNKPDCNREGVPVDMIDAALAPTSGAVC